MEEQRFFKKKNVYPALSRKPRPAKGGSAGMNPACSKE